MTLKENEIIELTMSITALIPEEDFEKTVLNDDDYKHEFDISWSFDDGKSSGGDNFTLNEGESPSFGWEIDSYIKYDFLQIFNEIDEYEIFDVDKDDVEYQSAKIKVISVKNV